MTRLSTILRLLAAAAVLAVVPAACGGDNTEGALGDAEATVQQALEDDEIVRAEAERLEGVVERELDDLASASSTSDVEATAEDVRGELESSRKRLDEAELSADADQRRDELVSAVEQLEGELADLQRAAEDGDLVRTLERASELSIDELQRELAEAQS